MAGIHDVFFIFFSLRARSCRSFFRYEGKDGGEWDTNEEEEMEEEEEEEEGEEVVVAAANGGMIFSPGARAKLRARDGMRMLLVRRASLMSAAPRRCYEPDYDYFSD